MLKRGCVSLAALALAAVPMMSLAPAYAEPGAPEKNKIQFVLDSSGSMAAKDKAGRPKIEAAREALHKMTDSLDSNANVGMRVYGATVKEEAQGGQLPPNACSDTQKVVDFGTGNRAELHSAIDRYTPTGFTPTVQALKAAVDDMGTEGKRHIVLVSDGEANCSPNPCDEIKAMQKSGVTFQVDSVGMSLSDKARAELQCISEATNGTYYEANNTEQLTKSLDRISKRALREADFQGKPVQGSEDPATAPYLEPGQYLDAYALDKPKYYRIKPPAGNSVHVSATMKAGSADKLSTPGMKIKIQDDAQRSCSDQYINTQSATYSRPLMTAGAVYDPVLTGRSTCPGANELLVEASLYEPNQARTPMPVELRVDAVPWLDLPMGKPTVKANDSYVEGVVYRDYPMPRGLGDGVSLLKVAPATQQVVGGTSFNSAAELQPGVSQDEVMVGETLVYKVKLDWGQDAMLMIDSPGDKKAFTYLQAYGPNRLAYYTPWEFGGLSQSSRMLGGDNKTQAVAAYVPPVRANNRFHRWEKVYAMAEPGYAYFVVNVGPDYVKDIGEASVPLRLNLRVEGKAGEGAPPADAKRGTVSTPNPSASATRTATGSPSTTPAVTPAASPTPVIVEEPKGGSKLPIILGIGGAGLAITAGGGVWLASRLRG